MIQLSLWGAGQLSPIPEVRESAPLWAPESAAGNAAELERASGLASLEASLQDLRVTVAKIRGPE